MKAGLGLAGTEKLLRASCRDYACQCGVELYSHDHLPALAHVACSAKGFLVFERQANMPMLTWKPKVSIFHIIVWKGKLDTHFKRNNPSKHWVSHWFYDKHGFNRLWSLPNKNNPYTHATESSSIFYSLNNLSCLCIIVIHNTDDEILKRLNVCIFAIFRTVTCSSAASISTLFQRQIYRNFKF